MNYFLYLSSCDTCKRIIAELPLTQDVEMIDIKKNPITQNQLTDLHRANGSYVELINKRAQLFKKRQIDTQNISEETAKKLLLDHYTFLKRPILVYQNRVFIGNSKATVAEAKNWLDEH